jgi:hypothetical protein
MSSVIEGLKQASEGSSDDGAAPGTFSARSSATLWRAAPEDPHLVGCPMKRGLHQFHHLVIFLVPEEYLCLLHGVCELLQSLCFR